MVELLQWQHKGRSLFVIKVQFCGVSATLACSARDPLPRRPAPWQRCWRRRGFPSWPAALALAFFISCRYVESMFFFLRKMSVWVRNCANASLHLCFSQIPRLLVSLRASVHRYRHMGEYYCLIHCHKCDVMWMNDPAGCSPCWTKSASLPTGSPT